MGKTDVLKEIKMAEEEAKKIVRDAQRHKEDIIAESRRTTIKMIRDAEKEIDERRNNEMKRAEKNVKKRRETLLLEGEKDAKNLKENSEKKMDEISEHIFEEFIKSVES